MIQPRIRFPDGSNRGSACKVAEQRSPRDSEIRRRTTLFLALGDKGLKFFVNGRVGGRRFELGKNLFPDLVGALRSLYATAFLPVFEVAPVTEERGVEGCLIALQCMFGTEEMPGRADVANCLEGQVSRAGRHRLHVMDHLL